MNIPITSKIKHLKRRFYIDHSTKGSNILARMSNAGYNWDPNHDCILVNKYIERSTDLTQYKSRGTGRAEWLDFKDKIELFYLMYGKTYGDSIRNGKIKLSHKVGTPFVANRGTFKTFCKRYGFDPKLIPKDSKLSRAITVMFQDYDEFDLVNLGNAFKDLQLSGLHECVLEATHGKLMFFAPEKPKTTLQHMASKNLQIVAKAQAGVITSWDDITD